MPHWPFSCKDELKIEILGEHPFWQGGVLVWYESDDHTLVQSIYSIPSSRYTIHPYRQIIMVQNSYNSVPQAVATTIAFPSVFTLILYTMLRSQKSQRWTDDRADLPSITKGRRPPRKTSGLSKTSERPKDRHCFRPACVNRCSGKEPPAELQTCSLSGRVGVAVLVMPAVFCRVCLAVEAVSTGCWAS